jgi:hypothetical protein
VRRRFRPDRGGVPGHPRPRADGARVRHGVMGQHAWWPRFAGALREHDGTVGVGLHLNLTQGRPLGRMPASRPRACSAATGS